MVVIHSYSVLRYVEAAGWSAVVATMDSYWTVSVPAMVGWTEQMKP